MVIIIGGATNGQFIKLSLPLLPHLESWDINILSYRIVGRIGRSRKPFERCQAQTSAQGMLVITIIYSFLCHCALDKRNYLEQLEYAPLLAASMPFS